MFMELPRKVGNLTSCSKRKAEELPERQERDKVSPEVGCTHAQIHFRMRASKNKLRFVGLHCPIHSLLGAKTTTSARDVRCPVFGVYICVSRYVNQQKDVIGVARGSKSRLSSPFHSNLFHSLEYFYTKKISCL